MPQARTRTPHLTQTRPKASEVTVTRLPVVRCDTCDQTMPIPRGQRAADVLTTHHELRHMPGR